MSISISYSKHSASELKRSTYEHIIRNEKNAERVAAHTKSNHDPALAGYNVVLLDEGIDETKKKLADYEEARQKSGLKSMRKDAKAFVDATIQLSDDTLLALGWENDSVGRKLPVSKQSPSAIKNVILAYKTTFEAICTDEATFGHIALADIHFDESNNPHLDCLMSVLDGDNSNYSVNEFINGKNRYEKSVVNGKKMTKKIMQPKGQELSRKQGRLGELVAQRFKVEDIEKFDLKRGAGEKSRAKARDLRREAENKLSEARNLANDAYASKQAANAEYNDEWGQYRDKMRLLREQHEKLFTSDERSRWDEAARRLKHAKSLEYVAQQTDGFIGVAFAIIAAIQQYTAEEQIKQMNQERQKTISKINEQKQLLKQDLQSAKKKRDNAILQVKQATTKRDKIQQEFNALVPKLRQAKETINNENDFRVSLAAREDSLSDREQNVAKREAKQKRAVASWETTLSVVNNGTLAEREKARLIAENVAEKHGNKQTFDIDALILDLDKANQQLSQ